MIKLGSSFRVDLGMALEAQELNMLWIPPGEFIMGNREDEPGYDPHEDEPTFSATVSRGFWLGQYPITQAQWQAVTQNNPSVFQENGINRPVENVSWHDAQAFCAQISQRFVTELPTEYGFSLPTEMQWEYACRAGTRTPFYSGSSESDLARVAWYAGNSRGQTHPVGEKEANVWGLYDMHGNVLEWCYDMYIPYPKVPSTDWSGGDKGLVRIIRGAGFGSTYADGGARSGARGGGEPDTKRPWIGFRLCLRYIGN